ncbi:MAG: type II toxin-antitoxin system VapC family toxin [Alphaproteobacteria bacterium]|nr:type II toxin-antitoxin system VapC family toxin [Alphaproteobacteria bacterium]MCY4320162.1 type II toxin-antitoxin system VapC family toxin [Alphaproteobacteria bacterium]
MLVFDTNVLSELMQPAPNTGIVSWVAKRATSSLHLTTISEAELHYGLAIMPPGRRRDGLAQGLERMLRTGFANRILPFDSTAASAYAEIAATRRAMGRPMPEADCQIAAIARSRDMAVVTRNVRDFADAGIDVIDPWTDA